MADTVRDQILIMIVGRTFLKDFKQKRNNGYAIMSNVYGAAYIYSREMLLLVERRKNLQRMMDVTNEIKEASESSNYSDTPVQDGAD